MIANGPKIKILINGISTVNYLEKEKWIPREGHICLQAHSGGPYEILYKDIRLKKL
ncbi:family 16 glycoside hydrolase [Planctomycetota bacterium]